jgi:cell division septation protein DedD
MVDLGISRSKDEVRDKTLTDSDDTEITLGTGKLLGIFFGLVFVCAVFFTLGYLLGHSTAAGPKTEIVSATPTSGASAGKPSAVNKNQEAQPASVGPAPATPAGNDTTTAQAAASVVPANSAAPADVKASPGGTYTVQVAAVSKKEDADNLVTALGKKQYPVFMTTVAGDSLFHVQVGPFSDPKDAETMRVKLAGEGYDAIVKK